MLSKTALILLTPIFLLVGTVAITDIAVVDVRADGKHFVVPVPLAMSRLACQFIPEEDSVIEMDVEELSKYSDELIAAVDELRDAEDGQLVEVVERDTHVLVRKKGGTLIADVKDGSDKIHAELPLQTITRVLQVLDNDHVEVSDIVNAVQGNLGFGKIVDVNTDDGETQVKVWVF